MKKLFLSSLAIISFYIATWASVVPDEGMWLPMFVDKLNYSDMQKMGLKLTPDQIYSINHSSLKDGIVGLSFGPEPDGFFCTGGIVSNEGLLFTNHHCGYDAIQKKSSLEHDYLTNGFWAYTKEEELPETEISVAFFIRMENVTDSIIPFISDTMSEMQRGAKVREIRERLRKEYSEDGRYHVNVNSFYGGNEYYLFLYEVYEDVRLVGAPPSAIGKFGGDTDNWMWPRHTGDFSIFRVYMSPDGKPAKYSRDNIPLKPKYVLPISLKGYQNNDFAMIWGYPGSTERYLTSYGVEYNLNDFNPAIIDLFGKRLEIMKQDMDKDPAVKIKYASEYFGYSNSWKNLIGESRGIKKLKVSDKKAAIEKGFMDWVKQDAGRKAKYGDLFDRIKESYGKLGEAIVPLLYLRLGAMGATAMGYAQGFTPLADLLRNPKENKEALEATLQEYKDGIKGQFKDYNAPTDQKVFAGLLELYVNDLPAEKQCDAIRKINEKYKGDWKKYAAEVYGKTMFCCPERTEAFLNKPGLKALEKDPLYVLVNELSGVARQYSVAAQETQRNLNRYNRLFIAGLREMNPGRVYYPDANSTMRLTYGKTLDYFPADAVHYDYITTLDGVMEKEDPSNDEFIVPDKLKELYMNKDYGRYGKDGKMVTCFLTTNDITGGNSGSPVLNGNGELIGLAFDGNWEAMSGDIAFEPDLQRTISVDIRYVLFVIDKYAGAQNLINELTIAN
jgi:hypothetical protein